MRRNDLSLRGSCGIESHASRSAKMEISAKGEVRGHGIHVRCAHGLAFALVLIALIAVNTLAVEEKPLPAFIVTRSDGVPVTSAAMTDVNQYVLMYLAPGCRSCDSLLAMLNDPESPELASRVVIIVSGDTTNAAQYVREHVPPDVGEVTWYADVTGEAYRSLQFSGTPDLLGVRHGRLIWSINGVLNDNSIVRSVVRKWTKD
jgi:hypothetical protein